MGNIAATAADEESFHAFARLVRGELGIPLTSLGCLRESARIVQSIAARKPLCARRGIDDEVRAFNQIAELVAPSRVFKFPQHTSQIEGVLLRRGRIVPVCDVAEMLIGKQIISRRLYLLAVRHYGAQTEWVALPVTGECELINAEMTAASIAHSSLEAREHMIVRIAALAAVNAPPPTSRTPVRRAMRASRWRTFRAFWLP